MTAMLIVNLISIFGLIVLLTTSGKVIFYLLKRIDKTEVKRQEKRIYDTGFLIGKCENILTYLMVWQGDFTALAVIFAAKAIVRQEDIKKDSLYFLAGSLINFTYSIIIAIIFKDIAKFVSLFDTYITPIAK